MQDWEWPQTASALTPASFLCVSIDWLCLFLSCTLEEGPKLTASDQTHRLAEEKPVGCLVQASILVITARVSMWVPGTPMEPPATLWMEAAAPRNQKLLGAEQRCPKGVLCPSTLLSLLAVLPLYLQLGSHRLASSSPYFKSVSPVSPFKIRTTTNFNSPFILSSVQQDSSAAASEPRMRAGF